MRIEEEKIKLEALNINGKISKKKIGQNFRGPLLTLFGTGGDTFIGPFYPLVIFGSDPNVFGGEN